MKTLNKAFIVTTLCLLAAVPAYAGNPYRNDDYRERMHRLEMRIEHGIDNRELTRKEAKELQYEYRRIRSMAKEFREDGRLSRRESHRLDHAIERLNDQISQYKHNNQERHRYPKYSNEHERHDDDRSRSDSYHR